MKHAFSLIGNASCAGLYSSIVAWAGTMMEDHAVLQREDIKLLHKLYVQTYCNLKHIIFFFHFNIDIPPTLL